MVTVVGQRPFQFGCSPFSRRVGAEKPTAKVVVDADDLEPFLVKKNGSLTSDEAASTCDESYGHTSSTENWAAKRIRYREADLNDVVLRGLLKSKDVVRDARIAANWIPPGISRDTGSFL
jgi:hypothetical protein